jgi:hypothetical protein
MWKINLYKHQTPHKEAFDVRLLLRESKCSVFSKKKITF